MRVIEIKNGKGEQVDGVAWLRSKITRPSIVLDVGDDLHA